MKRNQITVKIIYRFNKLLTFLISITSSKPIYGNEPLSRYGNAQSWSPTTSNESKPLESLPVLQLQPEPLLPIPNESKSLDEPLSESESINVG